jgi:hypothetical protein
MRVRRLAVAGQKRDRVLPSKKPFDGHFGMSPQHDRKQSFSARAGFILLRCRGKLRQGGEFPVRNGMPRENSALLPRTGAVHERGSWPTEPARLPTASACSGTVRATGLEKLSPSALGSTGTTRRRHAWRGGIGSAGKNRWPRRLRSGSLWDEHWRVLEERPTPVAQRRPGQQRAIDPHRSDRAV